MQGKVNPAFVLVDELIKDSEISAPKTAIIDYSNAKKLPQLIAASAGIIIHTIIQLPYLILE